MYIDRQGSCSDSWEFVKLSGPWSLKQKRWMATVTTKYLFSLRLVNLIIENN